MKRIRISLLLLGIVVLVAPACSRKACSSRLETDSLYSRTLGEKRAFSLYLPCDFDPRRSYPIVYAADGQLIVSEGYKTLLDSLIQERIIPPSVVVGIHSDETVADDGTEWRYYEYVEGAAEEASDPDVAGRFGKHLTLFTREVRDSIRSRYGVRAEPRKTIFYGCSNGGDFGMTLYATRRELFDGYICFSPVGTDAGAVPPEAIASPVRLYVAYGNLEEKFPVIGDNLRALHEKLESVCNPCITVRVFEGGHERRLWRTESATALSALIGQKPALGK